MNGDAIAVIDRLESVPVGLELATLVEGLDPGLLGGQEVVALLLAEHRLACRFGGRVLRSMARLDELTTARFKFTVPSEVACATGCSDGSAVRRLELATDLVTRLPQVVMAMLAGKIDERKARIFSEKTLPISDPAIANKVVDEVLPAAEGLTHGQVRDRLSYRVHKYDPAAAARRAERAEAVRRVDYQVTDDGVAIIAGCGLPVEQAAAAIERVDAFALAARLDGDPRTLQQLRADAFVGLLAGTWHGPAPVHRAGVLELTVPLSTLLALDSLPGELAGWGPVCADIARRTAEQMLAQSDPKTQVRYTVHDDLDSDSDLGGGGVTGDGRGGNGGDGGGDGGDGGGDGGDGEIVATGITRRRPPAALGAKVRARTNRCVFPGCPRPATRCDLDHRQRRTDGGATVDGNLHPLCRRHHRAKDEAGWHYIVTAPGIYHWISPHGQHITEDRRRFINGEAAA
jgi:Domain of unknown function (DUF222)